MSYVGGEARPPLPPFAEATASGIRLAQRDALPLQLMETPPAAGRGSRGPRQRRGRTIAVVEEANRCIGALNDLYAQAADPELACVSSRPTAAQQECQRFILEACRAVGRPPVDKTPAEALRELRIAGPYAEDAPLGPVTFDPAKISLPPEGNKPVSIDVLWGDGGPEFLERFSFHCLAPMVDVQRQMRDAPAVPYTDVSFSCKTVWEEFVWRLARAGLVDFADEVTEVTGVFLCT